MPLAAGTRLGHFEILAPLGSGGMGEVYRARDLDLGRDVALKVLPEEFAHDRDRLARFGREARATAALNHPNVLAVHEVGESAGTPFVVSELLTGRTLRLVMDRPLGVPRTLDYIAQIAQGLAAAHDKGVVHRDIKPDNLFVTAAGRVKILDFGIAKVMGDAQAADTVSTLTAVGSVIGTAGYMAPEQVRGEDVDSRADVFALGAVFYEMLAGRRAFPGASATESLAAILKEDPPHLSTVNPEVPGGVARVVHRCLAKPRDERFQSARDVVFALEAASEPASAVPPRAVRKRWAMAAAALLVAAILAALVGRSNREESRGRPQLSRHVAVATPETARLSPGEFVPFTLSPDGTTLAYTTSQPERMFLRRLDGFEVTQLAGTDGAFDPFFSPDGQWIGFWAHGEIKRSPVAGGPPVVVCKAEDMLGASWGEDGSIVYAPGMAGLFMVPANGGPPAALTTLDSARGEVQHAFPQFIGHGRAVLFTAMSQAKDTPFSVEILDVATKARRTLVAGALYGRLLPTGDRLTYVRDQTLYAVKVAPDTFQPVGQAVAVAKDLQTGPNGEALVSVAADGTLAYVPYRPPTNKWLEWVDRTGTATRHGPPARPYHHPRLSPDGRTIALAIADGVNTDIWLSDVEQGTLDRLTFGRRNFRSFTELAFSPDGRRLAYAEDTVTGARVVTHALDGTQGPQPLLAWPRRIAPAWVTRAGDVLLNEFGATTGADVLVLPAGHASPRPLVKDAANQWGPVLSPDERYVAYASEESGRYEIFMTPYPGPGQKRQVTTEGGVEVRWSRDGRDLFYRAGDRMMAVAVTTTPALQLGRPRVLFEGRLVPGSAGLPAYDVAPDGRFLMMRADAVRPAPELRIITNWFAELNRLLP